MISAVVLAKNEERNIVDCLDSLHFCSEIIVIDDYSEDRTVELVKRFDKNIILVQQKLRDDFARQRNSGLEMAKSEWVLFIDADERVSEALAYEISGKVGNTDLRFLYYNGFSIRRADYMWGRQLRHGETGNNTLLRLARKGSGVWEGSVHEIWKVGGKIGKLNNPLYHYPHQSLDEFLKEIDFYTSIRAEELYRKKARVYWWSILLYPKMKFLQNYIFKKGFLDGAAGFVFAIMMSFHSFHVRSKLWQLLDKER